MKFFRNLFYKTLLGKIYLTIQAAIQYIKDYEYISDTLYSDAFKLVLKEYLNLDIKKDWIGRLYGVINPNIDIDGKFNITNTIIEFDDDFTNNNEYVKYWAHKQLSLIGRVFSIEQLYNYIDLEFKHVGPLQADNYLLIFDIVSRKLFVRNLKSTILHAFIYGIIAIGALVFLL